jgi:hypothetical protein
MTDRNRNPDAEALVDALLADAGAAAPVPGTVLMARVLDDAFRLQPAVAAPPAPARGGGWFADLADALGGWRGAGGLATATVAGLWIGLSDAAYTASGLASALGSGAVETLEVFPGTGELAGLAAAEG